MFEHMDVYLSLLTWPWDKAFRLLVATADSRHCKPLRIYNKITVFKFMVNPGQNSYLLKLLKRTIWLQVFCFLAVLMCLDAGASTCPDVQKMVTCFGKLEPVMDGVFCQQDAEGRQKAWYTEGEGVHVGLTCFHTRKDWRSQSRTGKMVALSQKRALLPSPEEGWKLPDAAYSKGDRSQLTQVVITLSLFLKDSIGKIINMLDSHTLEERQYPCPLKSNYPQR